jgi:hypothetical protein
MGPSELRWLLMQMRLAREGGVAAGCDLEMGNRVFMAAQPLAALAETPSAVVYFAGSYAYKLK